MTTRERILILIRDGRARTGQEIAERLGMEPREAGYVLRSMIEDGEVIRTRISAAAWVAAYRATEAAQAEGRRLHAESPKRPVRAAPRVHGASA